MIRLTICCHETRKKRICSNTYTTWPYFHFSLLVTVFFNYVEQIIHSLKSTILFSKWFLARRNSEQFDSWLLFIQFLPYLAVDVLNVLLKSVIVRSLWQRCERGYFCSRTYLRIMSSCQFCLSLLCFTQARSDFLATKWNISTHIYGSNNLPCLLVYVYAT